MHASSQAQVIAILEEELGIPRPLISNLTLIVSLHLGYQGSAVRRVAEVAFLRPDAAAGFAPLTLARWNPEADSFTLFPSGEARQEYARWAGLTAEELEEDLSRREAFLERMLRHGPTGIPEVAQAVEAYYRDVIAPSRGEKG